MHRTEGANNAEVGGKKQFTDGPPGTTVTDDWLNAVQEEIASSIEDAGLTLKTAGTETRDQLKTTIKILGNLYVIIKYVIIKDLKADTVSGGTFTLGAWRTRDLNTINTNITGVSLAANQFTLPAGTYKILGVAPAYAVDNHKALLYNVSDASNEILGSSTYGSNSDLVQASSIIEGVFTIANTKIFEIRHRCTTTRATNGFGLACSLGVGEVYTQVEIIKIAD